MDDKILLSSYGYFCEAVKNQNDYFSFDTVTNDELKLNKIQIQKARRDLKKLRERGFRGGIAEYMAYLGALMAIYLTVNYFKEQGGEFNFYEPRFLFNAQRTIFRAMFSQRKYFFESEQFKELEKISEDPEFKKNFYNFIVEESRIYK